MASRPLDIQYFAPRSGERLDYERPLESGQAFAYGEQNGQQTGVATNVPYAINRAEQLGIGRPTAPRPTSDLTEMLGRIPRPESAYTGDALSPQQRAFLAGDRQKQDSSPMATPAEAAAEREAAMMARFDEAKAYGLKARGESARVAGEEARKTEGIRQTGRLERDQQSGLIKERLLNTKLTSSEKIATIKDARLEIEGRLDRAAKSGDVKMETQAKYDLANINNTARLAELQAQGTLDIEKETRNFANQAALQAQREGGDVALKLLEAITDPFIPQDIRNAIASEGTANWIKKIQNVQPAVAPVVEPQALPQTTAESIGQAPASLQADTDGDGEPGAKADVDSALSIVAKGWNAENVKSVQDPAKRRIIENAIMMAAEVEKLRKSKIKDTVMKAAPAL